MSTLYRKYRPQLFGHVIGQNYIVKTITNEILANKIAHAYLFCGPRGTGKTTMARLVAKSVNCANRASDSAEPCNTCSSCQEVINGNSIDIIEIDAASHTGVDNVRENIIENAQFKPTKSKYKVFIIDEVHMLSSSAFNALLKTLEEPPAHAIFILATTEMHKLPATIISRCQRFSFKKVGYQDMLDCLKAICEKENIKVEKKVLERIVNKSDGGVRDAESLLGQIFSLSAAEGGNISAADAEMVLPTSSADTIILFIQRLIEKNPGAAIDIIASLARDGVNVEQFAHDTIEALRLVLIAQTNSDLKQHNTDYGDTDLAALKTMAEHIQTNTLLAMIESLIIRHYEIKSSPLPQLPLELFAIQFGSTNMPADRQTLAAAKPQEPTPPAPTQKKPAEKPLEPATTTTKTEIVSETKTTEVPEQQHSLGQTIKETISHIAHSASNITLEQIQARWNEIIETVAKANQSLGLVLRMSTARSMNEDTLTVTVPYAFHKDKLCEIKTKKTIEQIIGGLFSGNIMLACEIDDSTAKKDEDSELTDLAADFGGQLV